jgi:hypothetical protein
MARKLPERFLKSDGESFCQECDKVRALCRWCDRCRKHCDCPEECPTCGGLVGAKAIEVAHVQGMEICGCFDCVICHKRVHQDDADFGYGLTEAQTEENYGTAATVVCETCVRRKRVPPPASERGFNEAT